MQNAVAFADNDVVTVAWSYGEKPEGCMGFGIYRVDSKGRETALPSHAVFKGGKIAKGQTTADYPVQKFYWKDVYARLVAEKSGERSFRYKVVPLEGEPHALTPMTKLPFVISNEVTISANTSEHVRAYFNRGLISTQRISRAFKGKPSAAGLKKLIGDAKSPLRESLSGDMVEALTEFVDRAKSSGTIYAALYELHDEELLKKLEGLGTRLKIVLSNAVATDPETNEKGDGNQDARERLALTTKKKELNRIMATGHIGHNKFLVYVNKAGKAKAVLCGSTNWTPTGLCAQTNNTLVIEDDQLAQRYLSYWKQLAADTQAAKGEAKSLQGAKLRAFDAKSKDLIVDESAVESWFSPNTPRSRSRPKKTAAKPKVEAVPPDMSAVMEHIANAKHAILFLAFYPGSPSIANWAGQAAKKDKTLFVRGCVTNKSASEGFYYELKGSAPPAKVKGKKTPIKQDPRVIGAEALDGKVVPQGWQKELLKAGFAIIHDKVMVIDPFADDCVVITGSHNLGYTASYNNDENLLIVQGNRKLAAAYATHVLDVYDHFSWRYAVNHGGAKGGSAFLKSEPDEWLSKYFDDAGEVKNAQLKFWMQSRGV